LKALQLVGATADVLAALVGPEREMGPTRTDAVAEAEAELRATRAEIETSRAQADELGRAWLMAATQQLAEKDTDHDDGLTWTITLVIADFHLQIGGIYYCGSTFTGTRGQCVGIGQAQGDVSTLAVA
jgi:hypothetical protein